MAVTRKIGLKSTKGETPLHEQTLPYQHLAHGGTHPSVLTPQDIPQVDRMSVLYRNVLILYHCGARINVKPFKLNGYSKKGRPRRALLACVGVHADDSVAAWLWVTRPSLRG